MLVTIHRCAWCKPKRYMGVEVKGDEPDQNIITDGICLACKHRLEQEEADRKKAAAQSSDGVEGDKIG